MEKQETKNYLVKNRTPYKYKKQLKEWKNHVGFTTKDHMITEEEGIK